MAYIVLCICFNILIFIAYRGFGTYKINNLQGLVFNYWVCVITGFVALNLMGESTQIDFTKPWFYVAVGCGAVFITGSYTAALVTQKFNITISSISYKMSLAIPVLFSLFVLNTGTKVFDSLNYAGLGLALAAIVMSSKKSSSDEISSGKRGSTYLLPILLFLIAGFIDVVINFTNIELLQEHEGGVFTLVAFASAAVIGTMMILFKRQKIARRSVVGGIVLGVPNYLSVFFTIKSLSAFDNNGALIFPLLNIGIIVCSSLVSVVLYKERLEKMNQLGIAVSLLSLILISYQEIF
ncbi:hypothetical protein [Aureibacter tunicatorum]|uniref:Drug/metabolite transporter (DMT)-like permease n=1 Tax=Aureibacter tunicatorum TaxID=866807 RepID=A0AAE3XJQ0_9BACT|nr:hypothetical protein [Aureibacter tunicatorum]MDR6238142.1 drug/metabolite transporter (DMT)-like permease [Aureibacter tunicatorum]BDD03175.1 hypothetical protein AUTU_06580 [Aureibacter tunicatorum]